MNPTIERVPCVLCGRSTYSRHGICGNCQSTKSRQCARCGKPIRWYTRLCLACEREEIINSLKGETL